MSDQENPARTWIGELLGFFFYVVYVNKLSLLTRLMHVLACACSSQSFTFTCMAHVSGTCMKDSFKLKHLLGSTASLFCFGIYHMSTNIDDSTQYEA